MIFFPRFSSVEILNIYVSRGHVAGVRDKLCGLQRRISNERSVFALGQRLRRRPNADSPLGPCLNVKIDFTCVFSRTQPVDLFCV